MRRHVPAMADALLQCVLLEICSLWESICLSQLSHVLVSVMLPIRRRINHDIGSMTDGPFHICLPPAAKQQGGYSIEHI